MTGVLRAKVGDQWVPISLAGPPGPTGPAGPSGSAEATYVHVQNAATDTWVIDHPLDYNPHVTIVDSTGREVEGDIEYGAMGTITVFFSAAFSGIAYLS